LQPHLSKYWKIPPDANAAFVANIEDVLAFYQRPYDADFPVVCMDESNKQLVKEVVAPIPMAPNQTAILDHEYERNGVANIFLAIEPLKGQRFIEITEFRTRKEFAHFIKTLLDERYPKAKKVVLVMDNLNTHDCSSLYAHFEPSEARALADRLEIHYTPKHGSWLNIAEIEFSTLQSQCLNRRIADMATMKKEVTAWGKARNNRGAPVNWQFTNDKARVKLARLYPNL
jgi:DDE superfamily endonuclease